MKRILPVYGFLICISFIPSFYKAQCLAVNVPYFENFSSITVNNQFPVCWNSTNPSVTCLSFAAPMQCAAFNFSPAASSHFFTRAVQLYSGVNYSVSAWYKVSTGAPGNWTNFSIQLGTNQSSLGLTSIVSTSGILTNTIYTALSSTFSVGSSGIYFFSISATGSPTANAQYLYWDDLEIKAPCSLNPLNFTATASQTQLCVNQCATLVAIGPYQYTWNPVGTGSISVFCPTLSSQSSVIAKDTLTSCTQTVNFVLTVNPIPNVSANASRTMICQGEPVTLYGYGASSYQWQGIGGGATVNVNPTVQTIYTVVGTNNFGCSNTATVLVRVATCTTTVQENSGVNSLKAYPNPIEEYLWIEFEQEQQIHLQIINLEGQLVFQYNGSITKEHFSTGLLNSGVYFLKVNTKQFVMIYKLIKN